VATPDTPARYWLQNDAWFPSWETALLDLEASAQPEQWDDPIEPTGGLSVLDNYIRYTYARIKDEGKLVTETDDRGTAIAGFNTGLFTPRFEPIIGFFEANRNPGRQPWVFKAWVPLSDWRIRPLNQNDLKPARYFENASQLVYQPELGLVPDLDHILGDNEMRWPLEVPADEVQRRLMLAGAIDETAKRVQMNWRLAVPQFYRLSGVGEGHVQLLLPLRLAASRPAHLALVVDRRGDRYIAHTVLPLGIAYKNARLITRPESNWLIIPPSSVEGAADTDEHGATNWRRVSAGDRCPLCGESTRCAISADNHCAVCTRISDGGQPLARPGDGTVWLHRLR